MTTEKGTEAEMATEVRLISPQGTPIRGTLEELSAVASAATWSVDRNGELEPLYDGETEVFWDSQMTVRRDDTLVVVDRYGQEYLASECTRVPVDDPD